MPPLRKSRATSCFGMGSSHEPSLASPFDASTASCCCSSTGSARVPAFQLPAMSQQVADGMLENHFGVVSRTPAHREREGLNVLLGCLEQRLDGLFRQHDSFC